MYYPHQVLIYKAVHICIRVYVHMSIPSDSESLSLDSFLRFPLVTENNSISVTNYTSTLITTLSSYIHTLYEFQLRFDIYIYIYIYVKSKWRSKELR